MPLLCSESCLYCNLVSMCLKIEYSILFYVEFETLLEALDDLDHGENMMIEPKETRSSYQPWRGKRSGKGYQPWLGRRKKNSDDINEGGEDLSYMWSRLKKDLHQWSRMRRNQYQWGRL